MVIRIPSSKVIYSFSPGNKPVARAKPGDLVLFETLDALGGQVKSEDTPLESIDWSRVNPATGPVYVEGAEPGDTLVVDVLDIAYSDTAVILVAPGYGALYDKKIRPRARILRVDDGFLRFGSLRIKLRPMVGVIGVAPAEGEVPTGSLGEHGGNMDVSVLGRGVRVYLPVFVEGALLALGDLHLVQGDGEVCVSAAEVSGEVLVRVGLVKKCRPRFPVLDLGDRYAILAYGETLDEAAYRATEAAVEAIAKSQNLSFEDAYMLASLIVDLKINQVVDPYKGVRAEIPKDYVKIRDLLCTHKH